MPRKGSPIVTVGTKGWEVTIPRPPKTATHARLVLHEEFDHKGRPKVATQRINDFGCFKGVSGDFYYLRMDKKGKVSQEWQNDSWHWNGREVANLPKEEA